MALTLFGAHRTRASMPRWYMEEKGIPYTLKELDLKSGDHRQQQFLQINPFGKVPALIDDQFTDARGKPLKLFESGAILLHLAEQHTNDIKTPFDRALNYQWVIFANSTLSMALFVPSNREKAFPSLMEKLNNRLDVDRPLVGSLWSAADCAVHTYLAYLPTFFPDIDLSPYPVISELITRTHQSSSYRKATQ